MILIIIIIITIITFIILTLILILIIIVALSFARAVCFLSFLVSHDVLAALFGSRTYFVYLFLVSILSRYSRSCGVGLLYFPHKYDADDAVPKDDNADDDNVDDDLL